MITPVSKFKNERQLISILESTKENLNGEQQVSLRSLLNKYKDLFDGSLGDFNVPPIKLEIKPGTEPVHSRPVPVPHIHRLTLYEEIQRMLALGILEKRYDVFGLVHVYYTQT